MALYFDMLNIIMLLLVGGASNVAEGEVYFEISVEILHPSLNIIFSEAKTQQQEGNFCLVCSYDSFFFLSYKFVFLF